MILYFVKNQIHLGIFCLIFAYNIGSPQSNAPFEYLLLFYSLIAGFFVFGEVPDLLSFTGMIAIFLSGIYIMFDNDVKFY